MCLHRWPLSAQQLPCWWCSLFAEDLGLAYYGERVVKRFHQLGDVRRRTVWHCFQDLSRYCVFFVWGVCSQAPFHGVASIGPFHPDVQAADVEAAVRTTVANGRTTQVRVLC